MTQKLYEIFEKAKELACNGEYQKALEYFDACADYEPAKILFEKIKIFFQMKDLKQSEKFCIDYLKIPENAYMQTQVRITLAKIYKLTGRSSDGLKLLDMINRELIADKESFDRERLDISYAQYNNYFRAAQFSGNRDQIYAEFQRIKNIKPHNCALLFFLMRVSNYLHDFKCTEDLFFENSLVAKNGDVFYTNAVLNEYEIASKKLVLQSYPRNLWIALSSKCNVSCVMCHSNESCFEMSENNMVKIETYFKYLEHITWWGGEPTVSDKFYALLSKALEYKNIKHTIITNGQYMPESLVEIITNNDIEVILSLDSVEKEQYESIRRGASFEKLLKTIDILTPIKEKGLLKINYVVMKINKDEIDKIGGFLSKYGISKISFLPACNKFNGEYLKLSDGDIENVCSEISSAVKVFGIEVFNSCEIAKKNEDFSKCGYGFFCQTPWTSMTFSYDGEIYPDNLCTHFNSEKFVLNEDNLLNYWNSPYVVELRKKILKRQACSANCPQANIK